MKKILVPCDFSGPAVEAFQFAIDLASQSGGKVTVLTVIDVPAVVYGASVDTIAYDFNPNLYKELEEAAKRNYDKMVKKSAKGFTGLSFAVIQGPTSSMINDFINKKGIDLVVMGTHGATGLKEFFVGSNTEKIVRFSKVPVFAIRKAIPVSSIKSIVFPTSLQPDQSDFIKKLKTLQEFFNATLHILFLNTPFRFIRDKDLRDYARQHKFTNYTLNIRNDRYEPDGIQFFVEEVKADMLVMATHGRKGLSHFLSGSVTEDVVNHVTCPVWTYALKKKKS
jgi:nucleotide-binding universal stress UspA family protein